MNRSFQAVAALLVSLSGAMLAVTWIPAEGPRRIGYGAATRRRAATVPCGYATNVGAMAAHRAPAKWRLIDSQQRQPAPQADGPSGSTPLVDPASLSFDAQWLNDNCVLVRTCTTKIARTSAAQAMVSAFAQGVRLVWPSGGSDPSLADENRRSYERQRIEAEYAAAESAAAGPAPRPWLRPAIEQAASWASESLESLSSQRWPLVLQRMIDELNKNCKRVVSEYGWPDFAPALLQRARSEHERLALREALLRDLDRRFLQAPLEKESPVPQKPQLRPRNRKMILAAADLLKSLSQALGAAAEQLEAASRQDVAELHSPVENGEEKR